MEKSDLQPRRPTSSTPHEEDLKIFYNIFNIEKNETIIHVFDCICNAQRKKNYQGKLFISEKGAYFFHEHFSAVMLNKYIKKVKKRFFASGKFSIKVFKPELNKEVEYLFSAMDGDRDLIVNIIQQLRDNPSSFFDQQLQNENIVASPPTRLTAQRELTLPSSSDYSNKKKSASLQEVSNKDHDPRGGGSNNPNKVLDEDGYSVHKGSTIMLEVAQHMKFDDSQEEDSDDQYNNNSNDAEGKSQEEDDFDTPDEIDEDEEEENEEKMDILDDEEEDVMEEDELSLDVIHHQTIPSPPFPDTSSPSVSSESQKKSESGSNLTITNNNEPAKMKMMNNIPTKSLPTPPKQKENSSSTVIPSADSSLGHHHETLSSSASSSTTTTSSKKVKKKSSGSGPSLTASTMIGSVDDGGDYDTVSNLPLPSSKGSINHTVSSHKRNKRRVSGARSTQRGNRPSSSHVYSTTTTSSSTSTRSMFKESNYERIRDIPCTKYHFNARTKEYNPKKITDETYNMSIQEFLKYVSQEDHFFQRFHGRRKDLDLTLYPWERNKNLTYERKSTVKMNVKIPFSSKTHQSIGDHMRLTVLKGGKKVIWEHSFEPSGFFGSDCLYLLGQVVISEVEKKKVRVVVGAGPVYVKPLNILFKWKFNSVSMNILNDCFKMIKEQLCTYEKEIREKMRLRHHHQQQQQQHIVRKRKVQSGRVVRKKKIQDALLVDDVLEGVEGINNLEIPRVRSSLNNNNNNNNNNSNSGRNNNNNVADNQDQDQDDDDDDDDMFDGGGEQFGGGNNNSLTSSLLNWDNLLNGSKQAIDFCQKNVSIPYFLLLIMCLILVSVFFRLRRMESELGKVKNVMKGELKSDLMELIGQVNEGRLNFEKKWTVFQKDGIEMERNWISFERRYLDFEKNFVNKFQEIVEMYSASDNDDGKVSESSNSGGEGGETCKS